MVVYTRYEYRAAQTFLGDAQSAADGHSLIDFTSPTLRVRYWCKPDGSVWLEREVTLDGPEWDYSLETVHTRPKEQAK